MSKNLIPITEFPVAAALPDYLDAERIGVNAELIGRVAQLGCFKPEVEITAHSGETTTYHAQFNGMAGPGVASAAATGTVSIAKRSKISYKDVPPVLYTPESPFAVLHHGVPKLMTSVNVAEIQQRLQTKNAPMRDVKAWSKELDGSMSEALRQAARQNILGGIGSYQEAFGAAVEALTLDAVFVGLNMLEGYDSDLSTAGHAVAWAIFWQNFRKAKRANLLDPTHAETCYSLIPGIHLDRYAVVEGITRARRLIRPIK